MAAHLLLTGALVGGCAAPPPPAGGTTGVVIPVDRMTRWDPGIEGGVPARTRVCATVDASTLADGAEDATAAIQQAIDDCPEGGVVQLTSGVFRIEAEHPVTIGRGVVLRGAGAARTILRKTTETQNPLIVLGRRWLEEEGSVPLTADAANGAMSAQVSSVEGLSPGQLVLVDSLADERYVYWGDHPALVPGGPARSWFTRTDRPVGQVLEVERIDGQTVTFTAPLHLGVDVAHAAQLTRWRMPYGAALAGVEDLAVDGGRDDNITMRLCKRCWIARVDSRNSGGDSIAIDTSFRGVLRDSYVHDTVTAYPGGGGYLLSVSQYTADSLVENNIIRRGNKVMVMRASARGHRLQLFRRWVYRG